MNSVRAVLLFVAISLPAAAHGQCVVFDKPEDPFAVSDVVFVGTVVANESTGTRGNHAVANLATLRTDRTWKGHVGRKVRIGFDGPIEIGNKYVVFAKGNPLSSSVECRAAEPVHRAKTKPDWLARKPSHPPR